MVSIAVVVFRTRIICWLLRHLVKALALVGPPALVPGLYPPFPSHTKVARGRDVCWRRANDYASRQYLRLEGGGAVVQAPMANAVRCDDASWA